MKTKTEYTTRQRVGVVVIAIYELIEHLVHVFNKAYGIQSKQDAFFFFTAFVGSPIAIVLAIVRILIKTA